MSRNGNEGREGQRNKLRRKMDTTNKQSIIYSIYVYFTSDYKTSMNKE